MVNPHSFATFTTSATKAARIPVQTTSSGGGSGLPDRVVATLEHAPQVLAHGLSLLSPGDARDCGLANLDGSLAFLDLHSDPANVAALDRDNVRSSDDGSSERHAICDLDHVSGLGQFSLREFHLLQARLGILRGQVPIG